MNFIKYRKIWYIFSSLLVIGSIVALVLSGLNFGIDFRGGSLLEVKFLKLNQVNPQSVEQRLEEELEIGDFQVQSVNNNSLLLRFSSVNEKQHQSILNTLKLWFSDAAPHKAKEIPLEESLEEIRFTTIGPTIGQELKGKSLWALGLVVVLIVLYIAWAFRKVESSFKYGFIAIIALLHDVLITLGIFAFFQWPIEASFVAAALTILGYSVNDTIVVFDRVRENLLKAGRKEEFGPAINQSINQILRRSLFTSLTTLLVLLAVFFFGGASIQNFVLALIIGITAGTYSSIFLAAPLLVTFQRD